MSEPPATELTIKRLSDEAFEILAMSEDLQARGLRAEAVYFAFVAAERIRAIKAILRMHNVSA